MEINDKKRRSFQSASLCGLMSVNGVHTNTKEGNWEEMLFPSEKGSQMTWKSLVNLVMIGEKRRR